MSVEWGSLPSLDELLSIRYALRREFRQEAVEWSLRTKHQFTRGLPIRNALRAELNWAASKGE